MNEIIGIVAQNEEIKSKIESLFYEDVAKGRIIIEVFDEQNHKTQGMEMCKKGIDMLIARGGVYRHAKGKIPIPLLRMQMTTADIFKAFERARGLGKKPVFVFWDHVKFDLEEWRGLLGHDARLDCFSEPEQIEGIIDSYLADKDQVVIIGGTISTEMAAAKGMAAVTVNSEAESIRELIHQAREILESNYEERLKDRVMKATLEGIQDAVIEVDAQGKVETCNSRVLSILEMEREAVLGKTIMEIAPQLKLIEEVRKGGPEVFGEIVKLKGRSVAVNVTKIRMQGAVVSVVCTFQDITKVQSLEKRIRVKLNKKGLVAKYRFEDMTVGDPLMETTMEKAKVIGRDDNTVMIHGESGTGKEMIAQGIHNISRRRGEPFVAVNCAAISESLLESELFGYEEGAFTGARKGGKPGLFELAHGGTIFLDEINSVSTNIQAKLLRILEEKEVMRIGSDYVIPLDVRIVSAANEDLREMVSQGNFRRDLFYRLCILEITIPPLRDRPGDILPLFENFLKEIGNNHGITKLDQAERKKLLDSPWLGNVRELRNIAQRYAIFGELELEGSPRASAFIQDGELGLSKGDGSVDLKEINRLVERKIIEMFLAQGMGKAEVASLLGISRTALWKKLKDDEEKK